MTDTLENLIAEQNHHAASSTLTDEDNVVSNKKLSLPRLTKDQAIVLTAYTGVLCGSLEEFAAACEKRLGRPILMDEYPGLKYQITAAFADDFQAIQPE
jgi:hypothetical protein